MPLTLILTIAAAVIILGIAAGMTARSRRARPAVMGAGLAAAVVGLYLTGLTQLTANGVQSLIDWFQRTVFTNTVAWGLGLVGGGILAFIVGSFLSKTPKPPREPRPGSTPPVRDGARPQVGAGHQGPTARPTTAPAQQPKAAPGKPAQKGLDPEDAEIEELLRKRGIM